MYPQITPISRDLKLRMLLEMSLDSQEYLNIEVEGPLCDSADRCHQIAERLASCILYCKSLDGTSSPYQINRAM